MSNHQWVKMTVTPVDILPSLGDEAFTAYTDPQQVEQAEDEAVYGCKICDEPLNDQTINTECKGTSSDQAPA